MKEIFANGWRSFSLLSGYHEYTNKERVLKTIFLPFLYLINMILFVLTSLFYLLERLFAFVFRFFISLQAKIYRKRLFVRENFRFYFSLLSVLVFILFFPFILIYYVSMGIKTLGKRLMRKLIVFADFSNQFGAEDLYLFDDASIHTSQNVSGMMKDLNQTAALGSALESMLNVREDKDGPQGRER